MKVNRGAVGVLAVSLALSGAAIAVVLTPPRESGPEMVNPGSAADQAFVSSFYAAKERLVRSDGSAPRLDAGQRQQGYEVGDDYVTSFRDDYADDPAVAVKAVDLEATLEDTTAGGDLTTFRVSVSIYFELEEKAGHKPFTGGEVVHHDLTVRRLDGGLQAVSDQPLGI